MTQSSTHNLVASVKGVNQRYGKVIALDNVSLDVPAQKMIGLIGPDGVGKSTLLSILAGVRKLQQGEVTVLGGNIDDARFRKSVSARIAYLPQGLGKNLYPTLSIFENVDFFGRLFGQSREEREWRIDDLLMSTDLAPFRARPAGKLSGGMKQKLGLCCSLIHDPDFLILDEPTTGVDPLARRQFWELIDRIRARRPSMSVIVATAYMDEAEGFGDIIGHTGIQAFFLVAHQCMSGNSDNGNGQGIAFFHAAYMARNLITVHILHLDIHQNKRIIVFHELLQRFRTAGSRIVCTVQAFQVKGGDKHIRTVILHQENMRFSCRNHRCRHR